MIRKTLLLLLLLLVCAAAGGWLWIGHRVDAEVRGRLAALADRAGLTTEVGAVTVDLDGTVRIDDVRLSNRDRVLRLRRCRIVVDPRRLLHTPDRRAVSAVHLSGLTWREKGDPAAAALARRLREAARSLRASGGEAVKLTVPLGTLPRITVLDARVVTDTRTVLRARGEASPGPDGRVQWSAAGTVDPGPGDAIGFRASGDASRSGILGRVEVALERGVSLEGPNGARVSGIHRVVFSDDGGVRTGPALLTDASGRAALRTAGIRIELGEGLSPRAGRFEGAVLEVAGRQVTVHDLRFDRGGRRLLLSGVTTSDAGRSLRAGHVTVDLETGEVEARRVEARVQIPRQASLRARRVRFAGPIGRVPGRVELSGVDLAWRDLDATLERLVVERKGGDWELSGRGTVTRGQDDVRIPIRGSVTLGPGHAVTRASVRVRQLPLRWDPSGWAQRLNPGPASTADAVLEIEAPSPSRLTARGRVELHQLELAHWRLAPAAIRPGVVTAEVDLVVDRSAETVDLALSDLQVGPARARLDLSVAGFHARPALSLHLRLPEQPCQRLVDAIPLAVRPNLAGLATSGTTSLDLKLAVDLREPSTLTLKVDGDVDDCAITTLGETLDRRVRRLRGRFVHRPVVRGESVGVRVGPGTEGFVDYDEIPEFVREAAIATEDRAFFKHDGFRLTMIRGALKLNLKHMRYVYGGSTITQQLVKNLFLTRRKDLARKLEEAALVVALERSLSKRRILELYLNCIEYGPRIWGISAAARAYYSKGVSEMTPVEGIYLMAIKPYPKHGWHNARRGRWRRNWVRRMRIIFQRLQKKGVLDEADLEAARPLFRPTFDLGTPHA